MSIRCKILGHRWEPSGLPQWKCRRCEKRQHGPIVGPDTYAPPTNYALGIKVSRL